MLNLNKPIRLVLMDRDGVINKDLPTSVRSCDEFQLLPNVAQAIHLLNSAMIPTVIITNQGLVGRGDINESDLEKIHQHMNKLLAENNAVLSDIIYCIDVAIAPNNRRKPAPGMLFEAMRKFNCPPESTVMIGDAIRDMEAAIAAQCQRILVKTGKGTSTLNDPRLDQYKPVFVYDDLYQAVLDILNV